MRYLVLSLLALLGMAGGCKGYADLTADAFEKMLAEDKSAQLVDVRTPEEYAAGHLPGAINIDWWGEGFTEKAEALLDHERPVMVYCRTGKRSAEAAATLDGLFFKTYNLLGGYVGWTEAGKSVEIPDEDF